MLGVEFMCYSTIVTVVSAMGYRLYGVRFSVVVVLASRLSVSYV